MILSSTLGWTVGLLVVFSALAVLVVIGRRLGLARQVIVSATVFAFIALIVKLFFGLTGDENAYQSAALVLIENWRTGQDFSPNLPWTKLSVSFILAVHYHISIASPYLGVLALTPFYSAIPLLIGQASFNFFNSVKSRNLTAWAAVFLPQTLIWSPRILREVIAFMLIALGVYAASLMFKGKVLNSCLIMSLAIMLMALVRVQLTYVLLALFVASSLFLAWDFKRTFKRLIAIAIALGIVNSVFLTGIALTSPTIGSVVSTDSMVINSDARSTIIRSNAGSTQFLAVSIDPVQESGSVATAVYTAENLLPSLFGPFPWQWKDVKWVFAGLDGIFTLFAILLSLVPLLFIRKIQGAKVALILWFGASPLILANSLALANFGIAMRVRANVTLLLLPIIVFSVIQIHVRVKAIRAKRSQRAFIQN